MVEKKQFIIHTSTGFSQEEAKDNLIRSLSKAETHVMCRFVQCLRNYKETTPICLSNVTGQCLLAEIDKMYHDKQLKTDSVYCTVDIKSRVFAMYKLECDIKSVDSEAYTIKEKLPNGKMKMYEVYSMEEVLQTIDFITRQFVTHKDLGTVISVFSVDCECLGTARYVLKRKQKQCNRIPRGCVAIPEYMYYFYGFFSV